MVGDRSRGPSGIRAMPFCVRLFCVAAGLWASVAGADDVARTGGPYVPTPAPVVNAMLDQGLV